MRIFLGYQLFLCEVQVWSRAWSKNEVPVLTACQGGGFALNCSGSSNFLVAGQGVRLDSAYHFKD